MSFQTPLRYPVLALALACVAAAPLAAEPPFADRAPAGFERLVVFASESASFDAAAQVLSGDVVVNGAARTGVSLSLGPGVTTPQGFAVRADRVELAARAAVGGKLACNQISANGRLAARCGRLRLPVFRQLPPFRVAAPGAGPRDVVVASGRTVSLPPGRYLELRIGAGGRALLAGGVYHFQSVTGELRSSLLFSAPAEVRIGGRLVLGPGSALAPAQPLAARAAVVYVHGEDQPAAARPAAVSFGARSTVVATLYAPRGTLSLGPSSRATGAFVARRVSVGAASVVALASGFREEPPPPEPPLAAEPQTVFTNGGEPLEILLTGSTSQRGDLEFSLPALPRKGRVDGPHPIVPEPVFDPDRQELVQPPVRSAVVIYFPESTENPADSFTFEVVDGSGAKAQAEVAINPPPGDDLPPSERVDALDGLYETRAETPVVIVLRGNAPEGVGLDFEIAGEPLFGALGELVPGREEPRRSARVEYLPRSGHLGLDSFVFTVCGFVGAERQCERAAATVDTRPDPEAALRPAYDQEVATLRDAAIEIHLTGTARGREEQVAFRVIELPRRGLLFDSRGNPIREVPYPLLEGVVIFRPDQGFIGVDRFLFEGADALGTALAKVGVHVLLGSCQDSRIFCDDGRP